MLLREKRCTTGVKYFFLVKLCFSLSFYIRDEAVHLHLAISHYNNTFGSLFLETSSNIWANFSFGANNDNDNDNGDFLKRLL